MSNSRLPLLSLHPREVAAIWGGDALVRHYGKPGDATATIGESWECFDENATSAPDGGERTLAEWRALLGASLMGAFDPSRPFPILTKFIDARQSLSVQVHPGDAYARAVEHQPNGKTECWVVLEAVPGAEIVLGWTRATSRGEYLSRVADGSLGELLRRVPARAGDVFHLPAGTLHAIGAGIVIYETQQTSDLTYRIFDWNRLGTDGKPRELHLEKAADVLEYGAGARGALTGIDYELDGLRRRTLVADENFVVERVRLETTAHGLDLEEMPLVVTALANPVILEARGATLRLEPYATALVPAALDVVMLASEGVTAEILTAAPPLRPDTVAQRFSRAAVDAGAATSFLAQF